MIKPVNRDPVFLSRKASAATVADLQTAQDLEDTLRANAAGCVGMAANMIGVSRRIIVFDNNGRYMTMLNPVIVKKAGEYEAEEGCLSLPGTRKTRRYRNITVEYQDRLFKRHSESFTGFTAQIIQHEIDHCEGILI